ncbi:MAG: serine hydrolase [Ignavibacteriae bacterium]|nr:serine hydrolase [Ignavibacteriota bacterium]NOG99501.1 serine hydrolase [Ignavibacteriota bacterium]
MMKRKLSSLIILALFLPSIILAQSNNNTRLEESLNLIEVWIEAQMAYEQIPGMAAGLAYKDKVIWQKAFGVTGLEEKAPTQTNTIYSICSISKLFTSIAVMQLRDKGLLRLDDPVGKHLSWFNIEQVYPDSPPITIEALLTHSSGLPRESDFPYWNAPDYPFPTREEMIKKLAKQKTLYPSDKHYQYSNLALTLAGEIVAAVSGEKFEEYVEKNIIDPLKLNDTRTEMPEELHGNQLAIGYSSKTRESKRIKQPFFQAKAITPAAGFSSTVEDLIKFGMWQTDLLENGGTKIIKANTLKEMHRVHWLEPNWKTARGLGFGVYRNKDVTFVGHQGSCPGYRTALMIQPDKKVVSVFLANASGVSVGQLAQTAYKIVASVLEGNSDETKLIMDESLKKYIGTYSYETWGGEGAIIPWEGGLALLDLPTSSPLDNLSKLKHIKNNTFKRVRDDGELGEEIIFISDENGNVVSYYQHSNYWKKIK